MSINTYNVCEVGDAGLVDKRRIAEQILKGERVMIEPLGEVFMHRDENGTPQLDFILDNQFIAETVKLQIEQLQEYTDALTEHA